MTEKINYVHGNVSAEISESTQAAEKFSRRLRLLFVFCGIFILLGTLMLLRPVLLDREKILQESQRLSLQEGVLPAVRGRIIAGDGSVIAWNERKVFLYCSWENPARRKRAVELAASVIDGVADNGYGEPIRSDLTPVEYSTIRSVITRGNGLRVISRTERKYAEEWAELAGKVEALEDGIAVGVSGWEAEYEEVLSGVPGRFQVNTDTDGNWIRASFKVTLPPVQGEDVIIALPDHDIP